MKRATVLVYFFVIVVGWAQGQDIVTIDPPEPMELGEFGLAMEAVDDVSGDGRQELAVSARVASENDNTNDGRVYLFDLPDVTLLRSFDPPFEESVFDASFGIELLNLGVLNAGMPPVLAIAADQMGAGDGRVFFFDASDGTLLDTLEPPTAGLTGRFGIALARVPDTNGDGVDEIAVGETTEFSSDVGVQSGRVHLFDPVTGMLLRTFLSPNAEVGGAFGSSVVGIRDLDEDDAGDVVVGAWNENPGSSLTDEGRVYIFSGADGTLIEELVSPSPVTGGRFGWSLTTIGVGDGTSDNIVIGALLEGEEIAAKGVPLRMGRVHVYDPDEGRGFFIAVPGADGPEFEFFRFGQSLANMGDADGDGNEDFLAGAPLSTPPGGPDDSGAVTVHTGADGAILVTVTSPAPGSMGFFGSVTLTLLDLDDDEVREWVVSASGENETQLAGRIHLVMSQQFNFRPIGNSDSDDDGIIDSMDNCPDVDNPEQFDFDNDGIGDACDPCPMIADPNPVDTDNDGFGDECDVCPMDPDPEQLDLDNDGLGNECDNCPSDINPDQFDADRDGIGNACDDDFDGGSSDTGCSGNPDGHDAIWTRNIGDVLALLIALTLMAGFGRRPKGN